MATSDPELAADVQDAPLSAFVSLTSPQLALSRSGQPQVVPVKIGTDGLPRQITAPEARELAALLKRSADACDAENDHLLPPLHEYCERYASRHSDEEACG